MHPICYELNTKQISLNDSEMLSHKNVSWQFSVSVELSKYNFSYMSHLKDLFCYKWQNLLGYALFFEIAHKRI